MTRKALIISNPGEAGAENYCNGVFRDVENYTAFLKSPIGGLWYDSEIVSINRPTAKELLNAVKAICSVDYLFLVFSGHGCYSEKTRSTIITLKKDEDLDSSCLRQGNTRQTMILDCCRERYDERPTAKSFMEKAARQMSQIHPDQCRRAFDRRIEEAPRELIVLSGCSIGERSGDDPQSGGAYSSSLIDAARDWCESQNIDTTRYFASLSIPDAHQSATPSVIRKRGGRQNPQIEKPRSGPYFPFAVIA
jgi:hypothetical protein